MPGSYAVAKLEATERIPAWATGGVFFSVTRTPYELSIVCEAERVPPGTAAEAGWRALAVQGPLDFGLTGILASIASPLAEARISVFALATYDTDYVLVREADLQRAVLALRRAGHEVRGST
jgi:hypothetical protein